MRQFIIPFEYLLSASLCPKFKHSITYKAAFLSSTLNGFVNFKLTLIIFSSLLLVVSFSLLIFFNLIEYFN